MTQPNSFGLAYAVTVLRELEEYLYENELYLDHDPEIFLEAADEIERFMDVTNITLLEIEDDNQTTDIETEKNPPTPNDLDIDFPGSGHLS